MGLWRITLALVVLVIGIGAAVLSIVGVPWGGSSSHVRYLTTTAKVGTVESSVTATGNVAAAVSYDLSFSGNSVVSSSSSSSSSGTSGGLGSSSGSSVASGSGTCPSPRRSGAPSSGRSSEESIVTTIGRNRIPLLLLGLVATAAGGFTLLRAAGVVGRGDEPLLTF